MWLSSAYVYLIDHYNCFKFYIFSIFEEKYDIYYFINGFSYLLIVDILYIWSVLVNGNIIGS